MSDLPLPALGSVWSPRKGDPRSVVAIEPTLTGVVVVKYRLWHESHGAYGSVRCMPVKLWHRWVSMQECEALEVEA